VAAQHVVVARGTSAGDPAAIRTVTGEDRVREIARMLAGDDRDPTATAHARALLDGDSAFE
jgi:DNA repair protein RecN (Recombination protein N)